MEQQIKIPVRVVNSMQTVIDFYIRDERKHYEESPDSGHIFLEMSVVEHWLCNLCSKIEKGGHK